MLDLHHTLHHFLLVSANERIPGNTPQSLRTSYERRATIGSPPRVVFIMHTDHGRKLPTL
jgi:hypothetical protein